jgi:hypothetical protein
MGHAYLLPGRPKIQAALEIEPVSAGPELPVPPTAAPIELTNQQQPAILGGVQVPAELGDTRFELLQRQFRGL